MVTPSLSKKRFAKSILKEEEKESVYESKTNSALKIEGSKWTVRSKRSYNAKIKDFIRISMNFKELSLSLHTNFKQNLTLKQISQLKTDSKYLCSVELTYNLIEKSKIGKSLNLFLEKANFLKNTNLIRGLITEVRTVQRRVTKFINNFFFDENHLADSDISSYHSKSPVRRSNFQKKSENGLEMLMKASQKIDQNVHSKRVRTSSSFLCQSSSYQMSWRKFSGSENAFLPPSHFQRESQLAESSPQRPPQLNRAEEVSPILEEFLRSKRNKTRSNSNEISSINFSLIPSSLEPSKSLENLLAECLFNMPSCLDEFYKVMGELYVGEILKHRTDLENPNQLMKELLLGNNTVTSQQQNSNFISAMMAQAAQEGDPQNCQAWDTELQLANKLSHDHMNRSFEGDQVRDEEAIWGSQNKINNTNIQINEEIPIPFKAELETNPSSTLKKREIKLQSKEKEENIINTKCDIKKIPEGKIKEESKFSKLYLSENIKQSSK